MTPNPLDGPIGAFAAEFAITLPAIDAALAAVEANPAEAAPAQEAYRLCHAIKGAASMVGLAALGYLLNQAEDLLDPDVAVLNRYSSDVSILITYPGRVGFGVPDSTCVISSKLSPAGSDENVGSCMAYGAIPPDGTSVTEYGGPTLPGASASGESTIEDTRTVKGTLMTCPAESDAIRVKVESAAVVGTPPR